MSQKQNKRIKVEHKNEPSKSSSSSSSAAAAAASLLASNEDALLQLLVRTPASEHNTLRCVCRSFRRILDSAEFRRERMLTEWAEVTASVMSKQELIADTKKDLEKDGYTTTWSERDYCDFVDAGRIYDDNYVGLLTNKIRILVDGRSAGSGELTLVDRTASNFQELCEIRSEELEQVGDLFFDKRARPVLESVKQAMPVNNADRNKKYLVYIEDFQFHKEYRQHTWVGARALRQLLLEGILKDKWSIAIYIGGSKEQYITKEDFGMDYKQHNIDHVRCIGQELSEQEIVLEKDLDKQWERLTALDLRQFLRAGFRQPREAVIRSSCYHVFCVPDFLKQVPMPTHHEAMAIPIFHKPPPPAEEPSGANAKLCKMVCDACQTHRELKQDLSDPLDWMKENRQRVMGLLSTQLGIRESLEQQVETITNDINLDFNAQIEALEAKISKLSDGDVESTIMKPELQVEVLTLKAEMRNRLDTVRTLILDREPGILQDLLDRSTEARSQLEEVIRENTEKEKETWLGKLADNERRFRDDVSNCLKEGATVFNSNALHACAYNLNPDYMQVLLEFIPSKQHRSAVNKKDQNGVTPLMAAATALGYEGWTSHRRLLENAPDMFKDLRYQIMNTLLDLGADKSITDILGETALGKYRHHRNFATSILRAVHGMAAVNEQMQQQNREHDRFETILRPPCGPTAADDAILVAEES